MKKSTYLLILVFIAAIGMIWWYLINYGDYSFLNSMPHHRYFSNRSEYYLIGYRLLIPLLLTTFITIALIYSFGHSKKKTNSKKLLDNRLAKGEISIGDYKKIKETLERRGDVK